MLAADTGQERFTLHNNMTYGITGIVFHPDGTRVAVSGLMNEPVGVWDLRTREVYTIAHQSHDLAAGDLEPERLVFHPDGRTCASIAEPGTAVRLFDLVAAREIGIVRLAKQRPDDRFLQLVYRPDGTLLALCLTAAADGSRRLHVHDVTTDRNLFAIREQGLPEIRGGLVPNRRVSFSADGSRLAVAIPGTGTVELWDVAQRKVVGGLPDGCYHGDSLHLSPDGRRVVVVRQLSSRKDPPPRTGPGALGMQVYDAETGKLIHEHFSSIFCFSPDSRWIAHFEIPERAIILDAVTGETLHTLHGDIPVPVPVPMLGTLAFSPDGNRLATTKYVWDTATGKPICQWALNTFARCVFSPDGRRVAVRGNGLTGNQLELWDPETGQQTLTIRGLPHPISRIHFSRDGHRLIAIDEAAIHIWDATPVNRTEAGRPGE
jgi:WD40 repeat protein